MIGGGIHGVDKLFMDVEGVFYMAPNSFYRAGAGGGELDISQL